LYVWIVNVAEYAKGLTYAQYAMLQEIVRQSRRDPKPQYPASFGLNNTTAGVLIRLGLAEWADDPGYYVPLVPTEAGLALFPKFNPERSDASS
jgi:hypothetical protein